MVKLTKESDKKNILSNAKKLKHETSPWKKRVGISNDMTKMERDQHQQLWKEMKVKQETTGQKWYIKNGKVLKQEGEK